MNWMLLSAAFIVGVLVGGVASFFACAATIRLERDRRTFAEGCAKKSRRHAVRCYQTHGCVR